MRRFDARFGPDILAEVPNAPGTYRFIDAEGVVVYVGKAADLRRRLTQYRNAGTTRRGRKPHRIMKDATTLEWSVCATELDASLEEIRLIQRLKPRHNVAGAYAFLYPYLGLAVSPEKGGMVSQTLASSSRPDLFPELSWHGAYRSREVVALGFFALVRLLTVIGHPEKRSSLRALHGRDRHSVVLGLRRVPASLAAGIAPVLRGESLDFLSDLAVALLDRPSARARAAEIQGDIRLVAAFFQSESAPLRAAVLETGHPSWPVAQVDRDPLFLRFRSASR